MANIIWIQKVIIPTAKTLEPFLIIDFKEIFNPIAAIANISEYLQITFMVENKNAGIKL